MKRVWAVLAAMLLACSLAACAQDEPAAPETTPDAQQRDFDASAAGASQPVGGDEALASDLYVGYWELASVTVDGREVGGTALAGAKGAGRDAFIVLATDGTASAWFGGQSAGGSWAPAEDGSAALTLPGFGSQAVLEDGLLTTLDLDGQTMRFARSAQESFDLYLSYAAESAESPRDVSIVVCDIEGLCRMRVVALGVDALGDATCYANVYNASDQALSLRKVRGSFTVAGVPAEPLVTGADRVEPGQVAVVELSFPRDVVPSLDNLVDVAGTLELSTPDTAGDGAQVPFYLP